MKAEINKLLSRNYGICGDNNLPWFRVVWAPDELEMRHGTFNDFTESGIFIKQTTETRRVPKYFYLGDQWVLERLFIGKHVEELPDSVKGVYEPIWSFGHHEDRPLEPIWKVANLIVRSALGLAEKDPKITEMQAEIKRRARAKDIVDSEAPIMGAQLGLGEAVVVPANVKNGEVVSDG